MFLLAMSGTLIFENISLASVTDQKKFLSYNYKSGYDGEFKRIH